MKKMKGYWVVREIKGEDEELPMPYRTKKAAEAHIARVSRYNRNIDRFNFRIYRGTRSRPNNTVFHS